MLNHYAEGNCRENRSKYQHCKVLYTKNAGEWYHWTSRNLKKWPLGCEINFTSTRQHLLVRTIQDQQILHSGQLLPSARKQLPAMLLFSITLSRRPFFAERLTLRLMSGKEYQSYAEIPQKGGKNPDWVATVQFAPPDGHWCVSQRPHGGPKRPPPFCLTYCFSWIMTT